MIYRRWIVVYQSVFYMLGTRICVMQFQEGIVGSSRLLLSNNSTLVMKAESKHEIDAIPERTRGNQFFYPKDLDDYVRTSSQYRNISTYQASYRLFSVLYISIQQYQASKKIIPFVHVTSYELFSVLYTII